MISITQAQGFFIIFAFMLSHILGMFYIISLVRYSLGTGTGKVSTRWNLGFNASLIFVFVAFQDVFGTMGYFRAPMCFIVVAVIHRILLSKLIEKL